MNNEDNASAVEKESFVEFKNEDSVQTRGSLIRVSRFGVVFSIHSPHELLRASQTLTDFNVVLGGRAGYSGRAVVSHLVDIGGSVVCEASLSDQWRDLVDVTSSKKTLGASLKDFLCEWQRTYKILPEFKLLIGDIQALLGEMRLWLEQLEIQVERIPPQERQEFERGLLNELQSQIVSSINGIFQEFEAVAAKIESPAEAVHHYYVRKQIQPLVMCSPFAHRTFSKPLGYAGDYEMVNMILRDPVEGPSLYAKMLNVWFISQPPAEAHRNRVEYLTGKLLEETVRVSSQQRQTRIYDLGCGPAKEVQNFLEQSDLSDRANFVLLDFNDETLAYTKEQLTTLARSRNRRAQLDLAKKSVAQVLKSGSKGNEGKFDLVYCAGLFDYLPDRICKQLANIFFDMLAPGGLLIMTNVDMCNPIRYMLDYVLEWHLIYRTGTELFNLRPDKAHPDDTRCIADATSVNIFLEVRKPRL